MPAALPQPAGPRKRGARLRALVPFALLALLVVGWSGAWLAARAGVEARLDAALAALRSRGWTVAEGSRRVDGFPLRLRVRSTGLRLRAPSGWGVQAPEVEGQAYLYALDHWVAAGPVGLTLERPAGGPVSVQGEVIRASFAGLRAAPWRVVIEGRGLRFQATGAPFPLARAGLAQLYLRPAADRSGDGESLLRLEGLTADPSSVLRRVLGGRPLQLRLETRLTRLARFSGADWSEAARAWAAAGGAVTVQRLAVEGGALRLRAVSAATLPVGADGRLGGTVPLSVEQPPSPGAAVPLELRAGRTMLGPLRIAPAPRLF